MSLSAIHTTAGRKHKISSRLLVCKVFTVRNNVENHNNKKAVNGPLLLIPNKINVLRHVKKHIF